MTTPQPQTDTPLTDRNSFKAGDTGAKTVCVLASDYADLERRLSAAEAERDDLARWKREALEVANQLQEQEIGKEIGLTLGQRISPAILPWIKEAKAKLTAAKEMWALWQTKAVTAEGEVSRLTRVDWNKVVEEYQKIIASLEDKLTTAEAATELALRMLKQRDEAFKELDAVACADRDKLTALQSAAEGMERAIMSLPEKLYDGPHECGAKIMVMWDGCCSRSRDVAALELCILEHIKESLARYRALKEPDSQK